MCMKDHADAKRPDDLLSTMQMHIPSTPFHKKPELHNGYLGEPRAP